MASQLSDFYSIKDEPGYRREGLSGDDRCVEVIETLPTIDCEQIAPAGDVPDFFVWPAFHGGVYQHYQACNNYSPHNDALRAHVESLAVAVPGAGAVPGWCR